MYVVVVGGGNVGYYLTKELLSAGHEVVDGGCRAGLVGQLDVRDLGSRRVATDEHAGVRTVEEVFDPGRPERHARDDHAVDEPGPEAVAQRRARLRRRHPQHEPLSGGGRRVGDGFEEVRLVRGADQVAAGKHESEHAGAARRQ